MGSQGVVLVVRILSAIIIARLLGPEAKGVITLCILIPSTLQFFLYLGIGSANTYLCGQDRSRASEIVQSTNFLLLILILIGGITYFGGFTFWKVWLAKQIDPRYLYLAFIIFPTALVWSFFAGLLEGLGKIKTVAIGRAINNAVYLGLLGVLIGGLGYGVTAALVAFILGSAVELVFVIASLHPHVDWGLRAQRETLREQLTYGVKGHLGGFFTVFTYRADFFFINFFLTTAHVGVYSVATAVAELINAVSNTLASVLFPHTAASDEDRFNRLTPMVCRIAVWMNLVFMAAFFLFAQPIIEGVFGKPFAEAALPMKILLPGVVMMSIERILNADLMGRGLPLYGSQAAALGFTITMVLDLLLIPRWGIVGAASASTIAYSLSAFYIIYRYRLTSGISWKDFLLLRSQDVSLLFKRLTYR